MKHAIKTALLTVLLSLCLSGTVLAADGLRAFTETKDLSADTFSDVKPEDWFYNGVKVSYDLEIFNGLPGGIFDPGGMVKWDQAVTLAARVRAGYLGEEIPAAEGPWYAQYAAYAKSCGILPANCPEEAQWSSTVIDRQSLAYLFQAVVGEKDCPGVSDLEIPDLDSVDEDKRAAVQSLYTAGIFTGKTGGSFDPEGQATRGELATIISRLLRPAYRVSHDSRANSAMAGQESNLAENGPLYHTADGVYVLYRDNHELDKAAEHILRKDESSGGAVRLYSTEPGNSVGMLSGYEDWLYFEEWIKAEKKHYIRRISLTDGSMETVCKGSGNDGIDYYLIYDGRLFVMWSSYDGKFKTHVAEVKDLNPKKIMTFEGLCDSMYAYNGKLYVLADYGNELVSYDLDTKEEETLIENMCCAAMYEGKIYYALFVNGNFDPERMVYAASLEASDMPVKYAQMPEGAMELYPSMLHNGTDLYYLSSGNRKLFRIQPGREPVVVHTNRWWTSENPIVWDDCYLEGNPGTAIGVQNYMGQYPVTTGLGTAKAKTMNLDYWLGYSALMERKDMPMTGQVYNSNEQFGDDSEQTVLVRRAYYSGEDLVLDIDYRNPEKEKQRGLRFLNITMYAGGELAVDHVKVSYYEYVAAGDTLGLTAIIRKDDRLLPDAELSELTWEIRAMQRVPKD